MALALITGASTGIGRYLAQICAEAGHDLIIVARNAEKLEEVAGNIRQSTGREVHTLSCDLSLQETPHRVFEAVRKHNGGGLDILINNAGSGVYGYFAETPLEDQLGIVQLNVNALTHLTRLFLPDMLVRRRGRIMNVASTAAFQPGPLMAVYYATKAYVLSLSEALHYELRGTGVTITTLCPGPTETPFKAKSGMAKTRIFNSPNVMDPREVAEAGFRAMMQGQHVIVPGTMNRLMAFGTRFVSRQTAAGIARKLNESQ
jgi:uncharacterized protein